MARPFAELKCLFMAVSMLMSPVAHGPHIVVAKVHRRHVINIPDDLGVSVRVFNMQRTTFIDDLCKDKREQ